MPGSVDLAAYDGLAPFYDRLWGPVAVDDFLPMLERVLLPELTSGARVLDLCSGTGLLAAALTELGFRVTGVDASLGMTRRARRNAPVSALAVADARALPFRGCFDAVVSTFDSLNHLLELADVEAVLRQTRSALVPGGRLVFDANAASGYRARSGDGYGFADQRGACVMTPRFDANRHLAVFDITTFRLDDRWRRTDHRVVERPYEPDEILPLITRTGFESLWAYEAERDLDMAGHTGRWVYVCRRPEEAHEP
jgi:SAM-dependent methyltransferase